VQQASAITMTLPIACMRTVLLSFAALRDRASSSAKVADSVGPPPCWPDMTAEGVAAEIGTLRARQHEAEESARKRAAEEAARKREAKKRHKSKGGGGGGSAGADFGGGLPGGFAYYPWDDDDEDGGGYGGAGGYGEEDADDFFAHFGGGADYRGGGGGAGAHNGARGRKAARSAAPPRRRPVTPPPHDFFAVLGIVATATDADVKRAYRVLALQHHPDKGGDEERFKIVSVAAEKLATGVGRNAHAEELRVFRRNHPGMATPS